jgi:hypothetical protein
MDNFSQQPFTNKNIFYTQANQVGSSTAMEFHGHKMALTYLLTNTSMIIKTYITDRHGAIGKWMREICPKLCEELDKPSICHMYDRWHVAKSKSD